ncbi:MAG: D-glycerate dehydrogenase [Planctomycetota bacterium]|nr:D-glycerate dehydrogenase [Planctomycetota bacterium]MDA0933577.1 D-glycerate dehydrogenase [Planctomycetota bacterium]MDA1221921.1 D-glycerate dehydrogenase [Planctomycetota bacterium]
MSASVFVTRAIPEAGFAVLRAAGLTLEVGQEDPDLPLDDAALVAGVRRHPVLLCQLTDRVGRDVLAANPALLGVAQMAVGFDNIDIEAARALGIPVGTTPGVLTEATADLTLALLLAVARRVVEGHRYVERGNWKAWGPQLLLGSGVGPAPDGAKKTLGIVGFGRIGAAVARRALGFGMRVVAWTRTPARVASVPGVEHADLDALLRTSDFVSLHVPRNEETHRLIDAARLASMKPGAYLINTARGTVVDESALVEALAAGHLRGAGLDVFEAEPEVHPGLLGNDRVVLLPHLGSATREVRDRMAVMAAENAVAFARGEPCPHPLG